MSKLLVLLLCFFQLQLGAQTEYVYEVQLKDKNFTSYSLTQPQDYLSSRALARRTKFSIPIDSTDLPCNKRYIDSLLNYPNCQYHGSSKWLNKAYFITSDIQFPSFANSKNFVESTRLLGTYPGGYGLQKEADDSSISSTDELEKTYNYGGSDVQMNMHNAKVLHQNNYTGNGVLVTVIDNGFAGVNTLTFFDSLMQGNKIIATYNFIRHDNQVYLGPYHGTSTLGLMAANSNGVLVGTAPDAEYILLVSEEDSGERLTEVENLVMALEYADSAGTDIISSSIGYNTFQNIQDDFKLSDIDGKTISASIAATMASRKGILVCQSAGNEGIGPWGKVLVPGDADSIITVGGVDQSLQPYSSGSQGPTADGRIKPEVASYAVGVEILTNSGTPIQATGNSFSTPIIAGLMACILPMDPSRKPIEWINSLKTFSSQSNNPDNVLGWGVPNFGEFYKSLPIYDVDALSSKLLIHPNPSNGTINLEVSENEKYLVCIKIYAQNGSLVFEKPLEKSKSQQIDVDLADGLYWADIQFESENVVLGVSIKN